MHPPVYHRRRQRFHAFTLLELLVAVALITALATLAWLGSQGIRRHSLAIKCQANLRAIGVGMNGYANEHNNWLPPHLETFTKPNKQRIYPLWHAWIAPYVTGWTGTDYETTPLDPVFLCPAARYSNRDAISYYNSDSLNEQSYGYMQRFVTSVKDRTYTTMPPVPRNQIPSPSTLALVVDIPNLGEPLPDMSNLTELKAGWLHPSASTISERHQGGGNILYLDGHIEWRRPDDILGKNYKNANWNPYGQ